MPASTLAGCFLVNLIATEAMKKLVVEYHLLAVPDEKAAILAARARLAGEPPAG